MYQKLAIFQRVGGCFIAFGIALLCSSFQYGQSPLAHYLLDGLRGLQIGATQECPFGLNTLNVNAIDGSSPAVDILAMADDLPFKDESVDFVICANQLQCFYDPIKAIEEWMRVVRNNGYIYLTVPHWERCSPSASARTTLAELFARHNQPHQIEVLPVLPVNYWATEDLIELCQNCNWPILAVRDVDDQVEGSFTIVIKKLPGYKFAYTESALAHYLLDGLRGIEIGGSIHNPFGLSTLNVDYTDDLTVFKRHEISSHKSYLPVDIVASGDDLPFKDNSIDFVISSHVIEHFYDPIKTIKEWWRVVRPGGYVYIIAPHKERTFDRDRPRTTLEELIERHEHPNPPEVDHHGHYSVWITEDFVQLCHHYGWPIVAVQDIDDKVGNGFTVVLQKPAG